MFSKMLPQHSGINTEIEILLAYEPLDKGGYHVE